MIRSFISWRFERSCSPRRDELFVASPTYRMNPSGLDGEDAIWLIEQFHDWRALEIVRSDLHDDNTSLIVCATDPVTLLRYRFEFVIKFVDGRISSVNEIAISP